MQAPAPASVISVSFTQYDGEVASECNLHCTGRTVDAQRLFRDAAVAVGALPVLAPRGERVHGEELALTDFARETLLQLLQLLGNALSGPFCGCRLSLHWAFCHTFSVGCVDDPEVSPPGLEEALDAINALGAQLDAAYGESAKRGHRDSRALDYARQVFYNSLELAAKELPFVHGVPLSGVLDIFQFVECVSYESVDWTRR